jgi:predicted transcriptional regulator
LSARRLNSPQLRSIRWKLSQIEAMLAELRRQREALRQEILTEEAQLAAEAAKAQKGLVMNVMARWEQDMTVPEIADALGRPRREVERALAEGREARGVKVRRGRKVPERRRVRDAQSGR